MKLGGVVPCTNGKSAGSVHAAGRDLDPSASVRDAADRWHGLLAAAPPCCPARDLYKGPGWVASLGLVAALHGTGCEVDWRIVSAGYGLLRPEELVTRYAATFLAGHPDSLPGVADGAEASGAWWTLINEARRQPQPVLQFADQVDGLIVAASATYVDAIGHELIAAARLAPTVVFCAGRPKDPAVAGLAPRFDRRLREGDDPFVGGGDVGFNQRVATRCVEVLGPDVVDQARVEELLTEAMDREGPVHHTRRVASDSTVMAFIDAALTVDPSASRTALLRRWRDRGRACEQARFGALYGRVIEERDEQLTLGEAACG